MDSLKKWNNLTSDNVKEGTQLIVGYEGETIATPVKTEPAVKPETPPAPADIKTTEPIPAKSQTENTLTESKEKIVENKVAQPSKEEMIDAYDSLGNKIGQRSLNEIKNNQADTSLVASLSSTVSTPQKPDDSEGYFKSAYKTSGSSQTGTASSFKSTSGWDDKRYYCLHNSIAPGTIIKVTNIANQKVAYAKVLDAMPDLESNKDLLIRISKAMSESLGITTDKAEVSISY